MRKWDGCATTRETGQNQKGAGILPTPFPCLLLIDHGTVASQPFGNAALNAGLFSSSKGTFMLTCAP